MLVAIAITMMMVKGKDAGGGVCRMRCQGGCGADKGDGGGGRLVRFKTDFTINVELNRIGRICETIPKQNCNPSA